MTWDRWRRFIGPNRPDLEGASLQQAPLSLHVGVMAEPDWSGRSEPIRQRSTGQNLCAEVLEQIKMAAVPAWQKIVMAPYFKCFHLFLGNLWYSDQARKASRLWRHTP